MKILLKGSISLQKLISPYDKGSLYACPRGKTVVFFLHKQMEHMLGTILLGLIVQLMMELPK